jgi:hypothetical protein
MCAVDNGNAAVRTDGIDANGKFQILVEHELLKARGNLENPRVPRASSTYDLRARIQAAILQRSRAMKVTAYYGHRDHPDR